MQQSDLLIELFDRVAEHVRDVLDGLDADALRARPGPDANPIGWLVWHLTRVQDGHVAELLEQDQIWMSGGWAARFGREPDPDDTGYGHTPEQVASVQPDGTAALSGYYDAVAARTRSFLSTLTAQELDRVVDRNWDPPVTLGVRLVSIVDDDIQHAGQAAYVKGLLDHL